MKAGDPRAARLDPRKRGQKTIRPGTAAQDRATMRDMNVAPIDTGDLLAALRAHGESVMLPAAAYIDADVYDWERRHVFGGGWTCLGRVDDLTGSGDASGPGEIGRASCRERV